MKVIQVNRMTVGTEDGASLDFCLCSKTTPLMVSFYERSLQTLKAIGASFNARNVGYVRLSGASYGSTSVYPAGGYDFYSTRIDGYDPFYHGVAVAKEMHTKFFVTQQGQEAEDFYSFLMRNYDLPLMKEWSDALWTWASRNVCKWEDGVIYMANPDADRFIPLPDGRKVSLKNLAVYQVHLSPAYLENAVSMLLRTDVIKITDVPQKKLEFNGMDDYFNRYGKKIVQNLEEQLDPLIDYKGDVGSFTLKHKRPYPQQAAMINGAVAGLRGTGTKAERRKNHSNYVILCEGMGTGKTIQGAAICEAYAVSKLLHGKASLKDIYMSRDAVKYRNIIMCPPHLVKKWAEEVKTEVPYANAVIIDTFEELIELWKKGPERTGKDFYIISKDFAKLSYQEKPVPTRVTRGKLKFRKCKSCGREVVRDKCSCGSTEWDILPTEKEVKGLQCPNCSSILVPYKGAAEDEDGGALALMPVDFAGKNTRNERCLFCGEPLWQPYARNIGCCGKSKWVKISHFANKAKKGKKTSWVLEKYLEEFLFDKGIKPDEYTRVKGEGTRRYDPATFIKKHMKNFFDIAIFDEVHMLKGGDTAQGHAMHALVKASKRQLALTGTIAGGCAHHLFYMLFRLDPERMRKEGFAWNKVSRFSEMYGSVETTYEASKDYSGEYKISSRGKRLVEPKVIPGISPLIFSKFLLDKAVMLDITDMSSHLPALHENVILVDAVDEEEIIAQREYNRIVQYLKDTARSGLGMSILSTMLQFSMSYLDKPYGVEPILDPFTGAKLVEVPSHDKFSNVNNLLAKERKLVELVSAELSESRNCFVYAEYTNSPQTCVTERLKSILMQHVGLKDNEVVILDSTAVEAAEREEWIHEKAENGMKVCIVNPRCVETGLDFRFNYNGKAYNYPTILFYQLSFNMFSVWQSSRRHYRLNQEEECRTYYMAYRGTIQEVVISLIAEKMAATSAIQGKFSADGLSAMAQGVDTRVRLAQALSNMDNETGKDLQGMFDVVNSAASDEEGMKYEPMLLLRELIGEDNVNALERTIEEMPDSFDIYDMLVGGYDDADIIDGEAVEVETVEVKTKAAEINLYPEGSLFNPGNARKSLAQVNEEEVIVAVSLDTEATAEVSGEIQEDGDAFSLMAFLAREAEATAKAKEKAVSVAPRIKARTRKILDEQELLF